MPQQYYKIPELEQIYLEGSFVTNIKENNGSIIFFVDFVLREEHLEYTVPNEDEIYCYRSGCIRFLNSCSIKWISKTISPITDARGDIDYGNIDTFVFSNNIYQISGEWGEIEINSKVLEIEIFKSEN
ncbi:hypothetical protein ACSYAD_26680 [Acaryochloris marina NIES-2412]|uniref:hypothetical protein n=1 Tax=Acaryochloris marina TaxID=155978 RepID=UPI0040586AA7